MSDDAQPAIRRLVGQALAVRDVGAAIADFEALGLVLSDRSKRAEWGLDTATFGFANGSYLELVAPIDPGNDVGGTVAAFLERRGEGTYLSCFEVYDMVDAHERLVAADIPVAGPPQAVPPSSGIDAQMLWLRPRATGSGFTQFISFADGAPVWSETTPATRLFTQTYGVRELNTTARTFEVLGHEAWARYCTTRWGLDTIVYKLSDDTNIEIVAPKDASLPVAGVVAKSIERRGQGHYMTVFEVADVDALAARLGSDGVPTLGAPFPAPDESPWGPCRQLWIHPSVTHGCFIEFLTLPEPAAG